MRYLKPMKVTARRAKGGHLVHMVEGHGAALCGFKPGQTSDHLRVHAVTRAGWAQVRVGNVPCQGCVEAGRATLAKERALSITAGVLTVEARAVGFTPETTMPAGIRQVDAIRRAKPVELMNADDLDGHLTTLEAIALGGAGDLGVRGEMAGLALEEGMDALEEDEDDYWDQEGDT